MWVVWFGWFKIWAGSLEVVGSNLTRDVILINICNLEVMHKLMGVVEPQNS